MEIEDSVYLILSLKMMTVTKPGEIFTPKFDSSKSRSEFWEMILLLLNFVEIYRASGPCADHVRYIKNSRNSFRKFILEFKPIGNILQEILLIKRKANGCSLLRKIVIYWEIFHLLRKISLDEKNVTYSKNVTYFEKKCHLLRKMALIEKNVTYWKNVTYCQKISLIEKNGPYWEKCHLWKKCHFLKKCYL